MNFAQALEVLYATAQFAQQQAPQPPRLLALLPFPHLQQRLQQALTGVAVVATLATALPLVVLVLLPGAPSALPSSWLAFVLLLLLLTAATLAQLLVRFALLPSPKPFLPDRASIPGSVQTVVCALFDASARLAQEPQLLVLLTLCVAHSWLWKRALYALTTDDADLLLGAHFGAFVLVGGVVAFASLLGVEASVTEDPFVLDPRSALLTGLQRDAVRALRRGLLVYSATRALLVLTDDDEPLLSLQFTRASFVVAASAVESFAWLSTASMFRIQLFRANHQALATAAADGSLWDALSAPPTATATATAAGFSIEQLLAGGLPVDAQAVTPLTDQYVVALRQRVDRALQTLASRKMGTRDSASVAFANVEALDTLFQFRNLQLVTTFDVSVRTALFASSTRWHALVERTTAVVDSFTLSLQLLNAVPERKNQGDEKLVRTLEQSVAHTVGFVLARRGAHPLVVLDEHPHLANVRIPRSAVPSKVWYYVEARAQFAVRRFLVEEARRRVFLRSKVRRCRLSGGVGEWYETESA